MRKHNKSTRASLYLSRINFLYGPPVNCSFELKQSILKITRLSLFLDNMAFMKYEFGDQDAK